MNTARRAALVLALLSGTGLAQADLSANIGFASDYYFRGILQSPSSANGGIDFEHNGFYVGTWAADVDGPFGDGLEVDVYGGYTGEIAEIGYGVGYTGYFYTGDFDDTYQEINLATSYAFISLDLAFGEYQNFAGATQDYTYYALTVDKAGFYGKYGGFGNDFGGEYVEFGYGRSVSEIDLGVAAIFSNENLVGERTEALVFTIGKTFDIR